ncbi:MAG TPA: hypothetical protein VFM34_05160 [Moraxellaceae bacterium]|nr:hypothetical protein [Moraxellaceae bacterium]
MKLRTDNNILPSYSGNDGYVARLVLTLQGLFRDTGTKLNALAEGRISAKEGTATAAPTGGDWTVGDFVTNSAPSELGSAGSKYVVLGWVCVTSGSPGTWKECRTLTGG